MSRNYPAKSARVSFIKAAASSIFVLVLTSVHHLYGALIYDTPWRKHIVYFSIPAAILIGGLLFLGWRYRTKTFGRAAAWTAVALGFAFPVGLIGIYEGGYNHLVKNLLYLGGAADVVSRLFPPPDYELPNNLFFELTGIGQLFASAFAGQSLLRLGRRLGAADWMHSSVQKRVHAGALIVPHKLVSILGEPVDIPDKSCLVHLQFRRFAGCPVCSLHLHSLVRRQDEIRAAGIREVVVFHSTTKELLAYAGDLPFAVIADPARKLYAEFGVESSFRSLLHPRAWMPILRAILNALPSVLTGKRPVFPLNPGGGRFGLPADFLITSRGCVLACNYGLHVDDQWSADEILELARSRSNASSRGGSLEEMSA